MICIDRLRDYGWRFGKYCHLLSNNNIEELHEFAHKLGIKRKWFQNKPIPHYDLTEKRRKLAVSLGAKEITLRETAKIIKYWKSTS